MIVITINQFLLFLFIACVLLTIIFGGMVWMSRNEKRQIKKWKNDQSMTIGDDFDWGNFKNKK